MWKDVILAYLRYYYHELGKRCCGKLRETSGIIEYRCKANACRVSRLKYKVQSERQHMTSPGDFGLDKWNFNAVIAIMHL